MLQLNSWPRLTQLPAQADHEMLARVCALLACKPTVGFLVPRILDAPAARVHAALEALYRDGHVRLLAGPAGVSATSGASGDLMTLPTRQASFLHRLWQRLAQI
ncbi:hypothetical protein [Ideonella sp. YS5]|uniref:hypothetical protein n=1 Tax=Ideonella sp. YS5 TaxID=3453714 RepID=UPI003F712CF5